MDIESLNKTQIVLLTLLVSFVTSIATGIVTVSLVNQAPQVITDTVHRVIEKTVERVVPGEQKATIIENTKTIVISDQDFIIKAIERNSESLVRVFKSIETENELGEIIQTDKFVSLGIVISNEGKIMMDSNELSITPDADEYFILFNDTKLKLKVSEVLPNNEIALLDMKFLESDDKQPVFTPIDLGNSDSLKLGQSVISLGGEESNIVLTGIVSNLKIGQLPVATSTPAITEEKAKTTILEIETNLNSQLSMGLLIDLEGDIIGVKSMNDFYIPINLIKSDLDKLNKTATEASISTTTI